MKTKEEAEPDQSLPKDRKSQLLEETGRFLSRYRWQINLDNLLSTNTNGSFSNVVSETAIVEGLKKHLSGNRVYKFADVIRALPRQTCERNENG